MRVISKRAWSKHEGQTCPLESGSSLLSMLEVSECQRFLWDPGKLDQNGFCGAKSTGPVLPLRSSVCMAWSQQACLFTCKSSPSQALSHRRVGSGLCYQKKHLFFHFFKSDLLLLVRACLSCERQRKRGKENVLHCFCQKSRKWIHGKMQWQERERG